MTWTMEIPVISTGHLKQETVENLKQHLHVVADYGYGCFAWFGFDGEGKDDWPEDLKAVATWLWTQPGELTWVRFDSDGDIAENLTHYDW
jgi:hypothetical protein